MNLRSYKETRRARKKSVKRKNGLAPVVRRADDAIRRINGYPVDSVASFRNSYPLDSDPV